MGLRLFFLLSLLSIVSLPAHEVEQHFMRLVLEADHLSARLEMDAGYALPEIRANEDQTLPTGAWFQALSEDTKQRIQSEGQAYLQESLQFHVNGIPLTPSINFEKWGTDWAQYFEMRPDTFMRMVWSIHLDYPDAPGLLELFWNESEDGPSLALQTVSDGREHPLITVSQREVYALASIHASQPALPLVAEHSSSFWNWLREGFKHVIPKGLDHILFIIGLFLLSPQLKPLLTQSLVFTLAHSLTLALTVTQNIPVNPRIIEPLIALSIAYVAVENLFLKELKPWRIALIFALGLLHGMGFGSVMSALPLDPSQLITPIIGFNLGVEVAQVAILLSALALTFWWQEKRQYQWLRIATSLIIAATGLIWTVQRLS